MRGHSHTHSLRSLSPLPSPPSSSPPSSPPSSPLAHAHPLCFTGDEDGGGELEKEEVVRALIKTFHLTVDKVDTIRSMLDSIWCLFDVDGDGGISRDEFGAPDGLAETVLASYDFVQYSD